MNDTLISAITGFTLAARELLTRETGEQLEGIYGWLPDGTFGEAKRYPAIAALPDAAETRRRLELYVREEAEAGVAAPLARERLKREAAFTWLTSPYVDRAIWADGERSAITVRPSSKTPAL